MERSRLLSVLIILLISIAALVLAQMLWQLLSGFADIILLFILGWILSFVLDPVIDDLCARPIPPVILQAVKPHLAPAWMRRLANWRLARPVAVFVVYLGLLLLVILTVALLVPPTVAQLTQIASRLPEYTALAPTFGAWVQDELAGFGIRVDVQDAVRNGLAYVQGAASALIQNALGIFTSLLSFLANLLLVIVLSFYLALDGARMRRQVLSIVPEPFRREANYFSQSVNRTFGGFIRGQFAQALLQGIGTAVLMTFLGLNFVLAASLFSALFMLIPLVGTVLALVPPLLVVMFQTPGLTVWLFLILFSYQFFIVNVLMPRVLSETLGLHPLLVFGAILVGIKVGGFWGAFFGIPFAGVIWAMALYFVEKWQRGLAEQAAREVSSRE